MKQLQSHPSVANATRLLQLSQPLNKLGITYFSHARQYSDGRFTGIASSIEFMTHYLENEYYNVDIHTVRDKYGDIILWDSIEQTGASKKMDDEARLLGIKHTFSIIETQTEHCDVYHFASNINENYMNQVYLAKLDVLKRFILNYKDRVNKESELQAVYRHFEQIDPTLAGYQVKDESKLVRYINDPLFNTGQNTSLLLSDRILLLHYQTQQPIQLSFQQSKCVIGLLRGLTAKEIGKQLDLSHRTVEHYLERIRIVLGCKSNKDLIFRYTDQLQAYLISQADAL